MYVATLHKYVYIHYVQYMHGAKHALMYLTRYSRTMRINVMYKILLRSMWGQCVAMLCARKDNFV